MFVLTDSDVSAQLSRNQRSLETAERRARLNFDAAPASKPRRDQAMIIGTVISRLAAIIRQPVSTLPAGS
jgi:hypothetical protein